MEKCEFSETQFVVAYSHELFKKNKDEFVLWMPSTREEKAWASDLILKHYAPSGHYKYSEFYQFKRSKFYNHEVFDGLKTKITIDTSVSPKYGFNIYNSKKTRQFNVLQKISTRPRCHAFYCAPVFHTVNEFDAFFSANAIMTNSKLIPINQGELSRARIPLNSNHQIIFDKRQQYLCSDPIEIFGFPASEKNSFINEQQFSTFDLNETVNEIYKITTAEIIESELNPNFEPPPINFFEVKALLANYFNIYWSINFNNV